jgi:CRP/FNR family cyclic AMP-dependent transcriptional regulator
MPIHAWPDIFGYLAGGLLLLTFLMRQMVPLRAVAIASSAAWLVYGWADHIYPVVLVHLMLLPLNGVRLHQAIRAQPYSARRALRAAVRVPSSR